MPDSAKLPLRDKQGNAIDPTKLQIAQYAELPPGLLFSSSDTVAMKRLGLSDSITAPCGGTIPTCAVADGKTVCGCGHVHPPQFHSVNLPAIFDELASLRERVKSLESAEQSKDAAYDPSAEEPCQNCFRLQDEVDELKAEMKRLGSPTRFTEPHGAEQANRSVPEAPDDALVGLALRGWKMKMGYSDIERMREALTDVFFYLRGGE